MTLNHTPGNGWWQIDLMFMGEQQSQEDLYRELEEESAYIDKYGPYGPHGTTFYIGHQQRLGELVEFDRRTVTLDEIMERCAYPEEKREHVGRVQRALTRRWMQFYQGPLKGPVPLLEESPLPTST